jgi:hypothetical protein
MRGSSRFRRSIRKVRFGSGASSWSRLRHFRFTPQEPTRKRTSLNRRDGPQAVIRVPAQKRMARQAAEDLRRLLEHRRLHRHPRTPWNCFEAGSVSTSSQNPKYRATCCIAARVHRKWLPGTSVFVLAYPGTFEPGPRSPENRGTEHGGGREHVHEHPIM